MNKIFKKLHNNLFSQNVIRALGISSYISYLTRFVLNLPKIAKVGDLSPLDKSMGAVAKKFNYRGSEFIFDCEFCDNVLDEDSYGFGIAREIFIRDCYFKLHPDWVYNLANTIIDLGGNRGAFSTLMTNTAERIVIVECFEQYEQIIHNNFKNNGFHNYALETSFIGEGGMTVSDSQTINMDELFDRYKLDEVDFIKMDIEGSEFSLFKNANWLDRVKALSMEVHAECGHPSTITNILQAKGFSYRTADENLQEAQGNDEVCFIYAWKS